MNISNITRFTPPPNVQFGNDWLDRWRKGDKAAETDQYLGHEGSTAAHTARPGVNSFPNLFEVNPGDVNSGTGQTVESIEVSQDAGELPKGTITTTDGHQIEKTPKTGLFGWW